MGLLIGSGVSLGSGIGLSYPDPNLLPITAGCIQDLDADKGITLDGVTSRVETWTDQLGTIDATQTTDANQPAYTSSNASFSSHSSVNGNGLAYWMNMDALSTALSGNDTPFYYISAYKNIEPTSDDYLWACSDNSTFTHFVGHRFSSSEYVSVRQGGDTATSRSGGTTDSSSHIVEMDFTGTNITIRVDGTEIVNTAQDHATVTTVRAVLFGLWYNSNIILHTNVEIARHSIFTTRPSAGDQTVLRNHFSSLYGITVS